MDMKMNGQNYIAQTNQNTNARRFDPRQSANHHIAAPSLNQSSNAINKTLDKLSGANMSAELAIRNEIKVVPINQEQELSVIEKVVMQGDLSVLNPEQRVLYYRKVCESAGLNPFTRPFDYITLNGKLTLYAKKDATEQLRKLNGISIEKLESKILDDLYIVKATARTRDGRTDEATGAVTIGHLKGDAKANAIMKAETKAKRRVTLSISGMGWTDETEIESIPSAKLAQVDLSTGEIRGQAAVVLPKQESKPKTKISFEQAVELNMILEECDESYRTWFAACIKKNYDANNVTELPAEIYDRVKPALIKNMEQTHARQLEESEATQLVEKVQ